MKVRFQKPDGSSFRHFDMPAIPRADESVFVGEKGWVVKGVVWELTDVNKTEVTVVLKEPLCRSLR